MEFFHARLKGQLNWAHAVKTGWSVGHQTKHAVPMGYGPSTLVGCSMSARGLPRMGLGCMVQNRTGLRPAELLGLRKRDIQWDDGKLLGTGPVLAFRLGASKGTKAKREQFALLRADKFPREVQLVLDAITHLGPVDRVFPFSLSKYRSEIAKTER